ncbi:hypothetical protein [Streptomyces roseolilacinus]|uniref:hypothetical protein n=1 Tax=Streptomyces roseolilacinus TaxID=66904 RepID=UPI0038024296
MTTRTTDSPASLYGVVSLVLGLFGLAGALLVGYVGIALPALCGALAVTFGALGLAKRLNRVQCTVGLVTGGLALAYPVFVLATFGG